MRPETRLSIPVFSKPHPQDGASAPAGRTDCARHWRPGRLAFCALLAASLAAMQSGLALLGLDEASARAGAQQVITARLGNEGSMDTYAGMTGARAVRRAFLALDADQRTAAARALAPLVKALILSPQFREAWEAEVKSRGGANHGVSVTQTQPPQEPAQAMDAVKKAMLQSRVRDAQQFAKNKQMPASALQSIIDVDLSLISPAESMMVASPAAQKAAVARYAEARKLLGTDPAAAQKAVLDGKLLAAGLQAGGAGVDQAASAVSAKSEADEKRRQQEQWNKLQLVPLLRAQLQRLVQLAPTVDFAAATQMKDKKLVFVNPVYEKKPNDWKLLYRAGKGPAMAAAAVAQQLLTELK